MPYKWQLLLLLLSLCRCLALRSCRNDELCVSAEICNATDDSGRGFLGPRILDRSCGEGLECCEKEQLESYNATLAHELRSLMESPPVAATGGYKSCGLAKECVPRHLCNGTANDNGRYLIMPRIDGCRAIEYCCPIDDQLDETENPFKRNLVDFKYRGCGYANQNGLYLDLVGYNDHEALFGEFPWTVALLDEQDKYVCGGTLIHPQLVLTSTHNILNRTIDNLVARAGEWDLNSLEEPHAHQSQRLRSIRRHEQFNKLTFYNDIALLVLEQPFQLAPHIQPLCLPPEESPQLLSDLRSAQCFATGWGHLNITSEYMEFIMKRIDLPIVEHAECQRLLRDTILGKRYLLRPSFLCAGGVKGKDTCKGDGGSPLFCTMPGHMDRYMLAGIVSWGIECAEEGIPAAYANVPHLRRWIDEQVAQSGFKLSEP